jgi:hypothetical protein
MRAADFLTTPRRATRKMVVVTSAINLRVARLSYSRRLGRLNALVPPEVSDMVCYFLAFIVMLIHEVIQ